VSCSSDAMLEQLIVNLLPFFKDTRSRCSPPARTLLYLLIPSEQPHSSCVRFIPRRHFRAYGLRAAGVWLFLNVLRARDRVDASLFADISSVCNMPVSRAQRRLSRSDRACFHSRIVPVHYQLPGCLKCCLAPTVMEALAVALLYQISFIRKSIFNSSDIKWHDVLLSNTSHLPRSTAVTEPPGPLVPDAHQLLHRALHTSPRCCRI
jgi:hypothetical protein